MGTRDFPKDHTYGRRPTRVMSTGWDGNLGLNQTGCKNVRSASEIVFGPEGTEQESFANELYYDGESEDYEMGVPPWMRG